MAGIGDTMTYLEGRVAAVEWACVVLMKSLPVVDGVSVVESALRQISNQVSPDSEPGFQRGFQEGIDRIIESARKL